MSAVDRPGTPAPGIEAQVLDWARKIFEQGGEIGMRKAFIDRGPERGLIVAAVPVEGPHDPTLAMLRVMLAKERAVGVVIVSEAWHVELPPGVPRSSVPADLSTYEHRREVVFVLVEHRALDNGASRGWRAKITRDAAGRPTLGPFELAPARSAGRMTGLLPPLPSGARA